MANPLFLYLFLVMQVRTGITANAILDMKGREIPSLTFIKADGTTQGATNMFSFLGDTMTNKIPVRGVFR